MFILDDPNDVRAQMKSLRPEYDLDDYVVEGCCSDKKNKIKKHLKSIYCQVMFQFSM